MPVPEAFESRFLDLLTVCADAPSDAHQRDAARLLGQELKARLTTTARNHNWRPSGVPTHPAWFDLHDPSGGPRASRFYRVRSQLEQHFWIGSSGQEPGDQSDYDDVLETILEDAETLSDSAETAMGADFFAASRDEQVARYHVSHDANPSDPFQISLRSLPPSGYTIDGADPVKQYGDEITVPDAGIYRVLFSGFVKSDASAANTDVIVQLTVSDVVVATYTVEREKADVDKYVRFATDESIVVNGPLKITNGSGNGQYAVGMLRIWFEEDS